MRRLAAAVLVALAVTATAGASTAAAVLIARHALEVQP